MTFKTVFYIILLLLALYGLSTVGLPFLIAFLFAFLLEPLIMYISKKTKIPRSYTVIIICSLFTFLVLVLGYFAGAKIFTEAVGLSKSLLTYTRDMHFEIGQLSGRYQSFLQSIPLEYQASLQQLLNGILNSAQDLLANSAVFFFNLAKKVPNIFLEVLIVFIALFLISLRLPWMKKDFLNFFDPDAHGRLEVVMKNLQNAVFGFIRAQIVISFFVFIVVFLGFLLLGVRYPSATAFFVTCVDILPVLGTGSVMVPMAIFYYFTGNLMLAVGILIHYTIIIAFRKAIEPKILSGAMGIGALSTLISMYIGFKLLGVVGLFIGPGFIILFKALLNVGILKIKIKF